MPGAFAMAIRAACRSASGVRISVSATAAESQETAPAPAKNGRALRKLLQRQVFGKGEEGPGISTVMVDAFNIVQDRIARSRLAGDPPDFIINPRLGGFGLFDFHRAHELIERGRKAAKREIEDIGYELELRHSVAERLSTPF